LDPLLPREGIAEKMIHHADRSFPKPWNGFGVRDFWEREFGRGKPGERGSWAWWE